MKGHTGMIQIKKTRYVAVIDTETLDIDLSELPVRIVGVGVTKDTLGDYAGLVVEDNQLLGCRYLQNRRKDTVLHCYAYLYIGEIIGEISGE